MIRFESRGAVWSGRRSNDLTVQARHERGRITKGWSPKVSARFRDFLWSVIPEELDLESGSYLAVTLTMATAPVTAKDAQSRVARFLREVRRGRPRVRYIMIVEFTRRRVPHYHCVFDGVESSAIWKAWKAAFRDLGVSLQGFDWSRLESVEGWLGYLETHMGKGGRVLKGQRNPAQAPQSWIDEGSLGRMWRKGGDWPVLESVRVDEHPAERFMLRRVMRSYRVAKARDRMRAIPAHPRWDRQWRLAKRELVNARVMLRCNKRGLSRVRGASAKGMGAELVNRVLQYEAGLVD